MFGIFRRRRLPHWDVPDGTYFVTACLAGSVPATVLGQLQDYRHSLDAGSRPPTMGEGDWEVDKQKLVFARWDECLDGMPAVRHLAQPALAAEVQKSIYHFAETRYHVLAYSIMPSHFHWVFHPMPKWCDTVMSEIESRRTLQADRANPREPRPKSPREIIMHSLKSFTANVCNRLLGLRGEFWQEESFDHWVRNDDELQRIIAYVENNPVKAKLVDSPEQFPFSSACDRKAWGTRPGEPLVRPAAS
jgi:putative transposase